MGNGLLSPIETFLTALARDGAPRRRLIHHRLIPPRPARFADADPPLPADLQRVLRAQEIERLYIHQAKALEAARRGENVLIVTGTASGKSLAYNLPILEALTTSPEPPGRVRALYLFPTKALEQDQLKGLHELIPWGSPIRAAILDGDTPASERVKLREDPPAILISNPDILHLTLLPHHAGWREFWSSLRFLVLDELHTYKGIFGSHIAHVVRRLRRVAAQYGASPQVIACSATVSNSLEFARDLTGLDFALVDEDGAPRQGKRFVFVNPEGSPYTEATDLLVRCVRAGFKTLAFAKARKIAELIALWAVQAEPGLRHSLRAYRAGYRADERRAIERGLFTERLAGVVTTSALELGIDVGGLDACILVGYPGSIASTWQRAGRVGRGGQEALILLVALADALDQYFMRHPEDLFARGFEAAIVDARNPRILEDHLVAAAAELPLRPEEGTLYGMDIGPTIRRLAAAGRLAEGAAGGEWYSRRKNPQRQISIRSVGEAYPIVDEAGRTVGSMDGFRAYHEGHPGAIYLHQGRQFEVTGLDLERRTIRTRPVAVDYYTQATAEKETEILQCEAQGEGKGYLARLGRLKVTEQVVGYEKRLVHGQEKIGAYPLELPPRTFETQGLWLELPDGLKERLGRDGLHFMGAIHAVEHAMIGLFPLFALCDRGDVGGISTTFHPQVGRAAIFIYDGYPGGIGLSERCYRVLEELLGRTLQLLAECPCEAGCPSCIHSPKCGSGNKPLDKLGAMTVLRVFLGHLALPQATAPTHPDRAVEPRREVRALPVAMPRAPGILVLDIETQRSAEEVGGWDRADRMGVAAAVTCNLLDGTYRVYTEDQVAELVQALRAAALVIGFNLKRFDFTVLRGYPGGDLSGVPTLDILEEIHSRLGFRLSLSHLAQETLGAGKTADGLQSLAWYKAGEIGKVIEYCRTDVELTRRLYEFGRDKGYLLYRDYGGRAVRLPVDFSLGSGPAPGGA